MDWSEPDWRVGRMVMRPSERRSRVNVMISSRMIAISRAEKQLGKSRT